MSDRRRPPALTTYGGHPSADASDGVGGMARDVEFLVSDVQRRVLPNGLTVLVKEVYPASVVSLSIWSCVGSLDESEDQAGISHFLEHMLFKGTPTRPVGRIAQEIHALGGYLNGFTSYNTTCYWIVVPSRCFSTALEIEADAILHPLLEADEIAKEARVILEELKMYEDRPDAYCSQLLMRAAYAHHGYGRPIIGYESVIDRLGVEELAAHYGKYYCPNNMCVVVVGDVKVDRAVAQIERALGHLQPQPVLRQSVHVEPPQEQLRRHDVEGDIAAAQLQLGFHIPAIFDTDTFACDVLSSVLGEGRSSRLYRRLHERDGTVTAVSASIFAERHPGLFIVDATLDASGVDAAVEGVLGEIERLSAHGLETDELQKAKNMVEASFVFAQETVEGQARKLGYYEMLGDYSLADRYVENLYKVNEEDVVRAARTYLKMDNCSIVTYRPRGAAMARANA